MPEIPRRTSQTLGHRASSYIMGTVRRNRRPVRNKKESQLPKAQKREDGATPCRRGAGPAGQRRRLAGGRAARPGGRPAARPKPTACTRGRRHPRGLREMRVGASEGRGGRGGGGGGNEKDRRITHRSNHFRPRPHTKDLVPLIPAISGTKYSSGSRERQQSLTVSTRTSRLRERMHLKIELIISRA